tara:strand:+ start:15514 stop:15840 length:327 start_codon:yes stop_codon:yes gene_type:complete
MPATPPKNATAPLGRGPAGPSPVLCTAPADPEADLDPLGADVPDPDACEVDAPDADAGDACDAEAEATPEAVTIVATWKASMLDASAFDITLVVTPRTRALGTYPLCV